METTVLLLLHSLPKECNKAKVDWHASLHIRLRWSPKLCWQVLAKMQNQRVSFYVTTHTLSFCMLRFPQWQNLFVVYLIILISTVDLGFVRKVLPEQVPGIKQCRWKYLRHFIDSNVAGLLLHWHWNNTLRREWDSKQLTAPTPTMTVQMYHTYVHKTIV